MVSLVFLLFSLCENYTGFGPIDVIIRWLLDMSMYVAFAYLYLGFLADILQYYTQDSRWKPIAQAQNFT